MRTRTLSAASLIAYAVLFVAPAFAQLEKAFPFRRNVESDPNKNYVLTERHGPWLIMCASFVGERGEQQARDLVMELRRDYNLPAYLFRQNFDYSQTIAGRGWEPYVNERGENDIRPMRMKALHAQSFDEIAVVVGDFAVVDDPNAQKTLERIKHLQPRTLEVVEHATTNQRMGVWREIQRRVSPNAEIKSKGPMRAAFIMPNPKLPEEYFANRGIDHFVMNMNKGIRHSLLNCPGRFSVRVATFRGDSTFRTNEIRQKQQELEQQRRFGKPVVDSKLAMAAERAHLACAELRKKGVEAYEFHDRYESYVCVGSFDWATRKLPSGKDELNPEIERIILMFKAQTNNIPGFPGAVEPKTLSTLRGKGIFFDVQPLPVIVPRAGVSTQAQR